MCLFVLLNCLALLIYVIDTQLCGVCVSLSLGHFYSRNILFMFKRVSSNSDQQLGGMAE
jgi:sensor histidine kinase YesM